VCAASWAVMYLRSLPPPLPRPRRSPPPLPRIPVACSWTKVAGFDVAGDLGVRPSRLLCAGESTLCVSLYGESMLVVMLVAADALACVIAGGGAWWLLP